MNYEALGRYVEAKDKLPAVNNDLKRRLKVIKDTAGNAEIDLCRLDGYSPNPDPVRIMSKLAVIKDNLERVHALYGELAALTDEINRQAEACGREPVNIRHD